MNDSFDIFEGMTSISAVIRSVSSGISNRKIVKIIYDRNRSESKSRELHFLEKAASSLDFSLSGVDSSEIDALATGTTHGGILALCTHRDYPVLSPELITDRNFFVLLEGIEDTYNFGYSVRSLYAAGVDGIVLPPRNWLEISNTVARSSAGTTELANILIAEPLDAVQIFRQAGFEIVSAGIRDSVSLYEHSFSKPTLLVIGGEKRGISRKILDLSDTVVRIEYGREFMGSLPSASAISVMAFEIAHRKGIIS